MSYYGEGDYGSFLYSGIVFADAIIKPAFSPAVCLEIDLPSGTRSYSFTYVNGHNSSCIGRLMNLGNIRRAMQQNLGLFEVASMDAQIADIDKAIVSSTKIKGIQCRLKIGTDQMILDDFQEVFRGTVDDFGITNFVTRLVFKDNLWFFPKTPQLTIVDLNSFPKSYPADRGKPIPVCYGTHFDVDASLTNSKVRGAWPTLFVDVQAANRSFLIAGHAIKSIQNVYAWTPGRGSLELIAGTDYVAFLNGTINGINCAYINITAAGFTNKVTDTQGNLAVVTCNVNGKETVGDSTGTVIVNPVSIVLDIIQRYLGNAQVNVSSFANALSVANDRGYTAAGGILEKLNTDTLLKEICDSFNMRLYQDSSGKIAINILSPSIGVSNRSYNEQWNILKGSLSVDFQHNIQGSEDAQIINRVENLYSYHWAIKNFRQNAIVNESASQSTYGIKRLVVESKWAGTLTDANDVANRYALQFSQPTEHVQFTTHLEGLNTDLTDVIDVTHASGNPVGGFIDGPFEVLEHVFNPQNFTVTFRARNAQKLAIGAGFLDDEALRARPIISGLVSGGGSNVTLSSPADYALVQIGDIITAKSQTGGNLLRCKVILKLIANTLLTDGVWTAGSLAAGEWTVIPAWPTAAVDQKKHLHLAASSGLFSNGDAGFRYL